MLYKAPKKLFLTQFKSKKYFLHFYSAIFKIILVAKLAIVYPIDTINIDTL